jgi:6-pyruvoyltetrahydropterin/6-carboxytetrahydropterin synthase
MFKAKVRDSFSAAHSLRGYQGDCERLHGHNYRVEVVVASDTLDPIGIVMDFRDLKQAIKTVLGEMDHHYLNELAVFENCNPSAEHIARHIHTRLKGMLPSGIIMHEVAVWENDNCCAIYSE